MAPTLTVVPASAPPESALPPPVPDARLALRLGEAAEAIGVCRVTFWRLLRAGEIPVVHIGSMKRILRRDLEAWLEANKG